MTAAIAVMPSKCGGETGSFAEHSRGLFWQICMVHIGTIDSGAQGMWKCCTNASDLIRLFPPSKLRSLIIAHTKAQSLAFAQWVYSARSGRRVCTLRSGRVVVLLQKSADTTTSSLMAVNAWMRAFPVHRSGCVYLLDSTVLLIDRLVSFEVKNFISSTWCLF